MEPSEFMEPEPGFGKKLVYNNYKEAKKVEGGGKVSIEFKMQFT